MLHDDQLIRHQESDKRDKFKTTNQIEIIISRVKKIRIRNLFRCEVIKKYLE